MPKRKVQDVSEEDDQLEPTASATKHWPSPPAHEQSPPQNGQINPMTTGNSPTSSLLQEGSSSYTDAETGRARKRRKSVQFSNVTVYLFPRQQGFTCVPSSGGMTLGMTNSHSEVKSLTLAEHEQECRISRSNQLAVLRRQQQSLEESEDSDANDDESNGEEDEEEEEYESADDTIFPIAISIKQRRVLLKEAGCLVDNSEREDCQFIRNSREACGCQCQTVCKPDECSCAINNISCQVDRFSYPCGCTKNGCGNASGRTEFNPMRVRRHFVETMARLHSETVKEHQQQTQGSSSSASHIEEDQVGSGCYAEVEHRGSSCEMSYANSVTTYTHSSQEQHYGYTSVESSQSYHLHAPNASVAISAYSSSSTTMCQQTPTCHQSYGYYPDQIDYDTNQYHGSVDMSHHSGASHLATAASHIGDVYAPSPAYHYMQPSAETCSNQMISSGPSYPASDLTYSSAHHPLFTNQQYMTQTNHYHQNLYEDRANSDESDTSADSSVSEAAGRTLDFGELIKQSLVETASA